MTWHQADLSTTPEAEVAFAGAQTIVHTARVAGVPARLVRASVEDVELLVADSVARAAKAVGAQHLVHFAAGVDDPRVPLLALAGVPLTVVRGGGQAPAELLDEAVERGPGAELRTEVGWSPAEPAAVPWSLPTCSVQRYRRPEGWSALALARAYFRWLPGQVPLVTTTERDGVFSMALGGVRALLLRVVEARSSADCAWLSLSGGALDGGPAGDARMEFRVLLDGLTAMTAVVGYRPALPWPLYRFTQAVLHDRVMRRFGDWLGAQRGPPPEG